MQLETVTLAVAVRGAADLLLYQLVLGIVGVRPASLQRVGDGLDIPHAVVGVGISQGRFQIRVSQGRDLSGGLGCGDRTVAIGSGIDAAGHGGEPPEAIIAHGQGLCRAGTHGGQSAVASVVGELLVVGRAALQTAVAVIGQRGPQNGCAVFLLLRGRCPSGKVIQVLTCDAGFGVRHRRQCAVVVVLVGCGFGNELLIIDLIQLLIVIFRLLLLDSNILYSSLVNLKDIVLSLLFI